MRKAGIWSRFPGRRSSGAEVQGRDVRYCVMRNTAPGYAGCDALGNAYRRDESEFDAFRIILELFVRRALKRSA
jgi:hypothetical protein